MGWTFTKSSRADLIEEITRDQSLANGGVCRTLRKSFRGNVMYTLLAETREGKTTKLIGVTLLAREGSSWGYKDMDETMGPHYYDCPLSFLDEADAPRNETAAEWRATVRERATTKVGAR